MIHKVIKLSSLILIVTIAIIISSVSYQLYSAQAQVASFDFAGWLWSDNYGWVSMNSDNCLLLSPGDCITGESYSVHIDSGNNITGYGWSENVGWICFGDGGGDATQGCVDTPPEGSLSTILDETTGQITGWAKVLSLGGDGWLKIGRGSAIGGTSRGEACYDCETVCLAWTGTCIDGSDPTNCSNGSTCDDPLDSTNCTGVVCTNEDLQCNTCFSLTLFDGAQGNDPANFNDSSGSPLRVVGGNGYICNSCTDCQSESNLIGDSERVVCNDCSGSANQCELYGVNRDTNNGQLLGWGWNGTADGLVGAGWVHFNTEFSSSYIVFPWLQTIYGSIYTPGQVKQRSGSEGKNATYCIFAEDINVNIKTQNCEGIVGGLIKDVDTLFPEKSLTKNIYRNALGKIDLTGLTSKVLGGDLRNKYGQIVNDSTDTSWTSSGQVLNGEVYYFSGDLNIPATGITFINGVNKNGSGTVIVEGDLTIGGNIIYDGTIPTNLKSLASVAWIVKGDVIVDPVVTDLVGAFIILGDGVSSCQVLVGSDVNYPRYQPNSCGGLFSGNSQEPLTILGLAMARVFDFGRTFSEVLQGSERVIYDGRLTANPPPGLEGFVEGLPIIRDFSY